jgi:5-methylcytosine-specific restriction enzyme B
MSRYCGQTNSEPILRAAEHWRLQALQKDGAVFSDKPLWSLNTLSQIKEYFVNRLDEGEGTFLEKLRSQLAPASPEAKKLAAEMLWVMLLCPSSITPGTKRDNISHVWSWSGETLALDSPWLANPVLEGIG